VVRAAGGVLFEASKAPMTCGLRPFGTLGVDWVFDGTTIRPAPAGGSVWVEQMYGVKLDDSSISETLREVHPRDELSGVSR
jgi:hypothetical protein